jgi:hypothetical protein
MFAGRRREFTRRETGAESTTLSTTPRVEAVSTVSYVRRVPPVPHMSPSLIADRSALCVAKRLSTHDVTREKDCRS